MVGYICPTHTVSVTYKLGVTAAGMIGHAPSPRPTEGKRPIAAVRRSVNGPVYLLEALCWITAKIHSKKSTAKLAELLL
jgi:hypothetical protein